MCIVVHVALITQCSHNRLYCLAASISQLSELLHVNSYTYPGGGSPKSTII